MMDLTEAIKQVLEFDADFLDNEIEAVQYHANHNKYSVAERWRLVQGMSWDDLNLLLQKLKPKNRKDAIRKVEAWARKQIK